jgi:drug/metabolite transporter (DMT)-like permease
MHTSEKLTLNRFSGVLFGLFGVVLIIGPRHYGAWDSIF